MSPKSTKGDRGVGGVRSGRSPPSDGGGRVATKSPSGKGGRHRREPPFPRREGRVTLVGAGPGDPGLLTLKGRQALESADVVIYTGSLIHPDMLQFAPRGAERFDSAGMTLEEIHASVRKGVAMGNHVVRLHDGDPHIFGALQEQVELLEKDRIPYTVVPGVSSVFAAAAAIGRELTVPEVAQAILLTRGEHRTPLPVPLHQVARPGTTIVLYLSAGIPQAIQEELLQVYPPETPAAAVYRASWPDQKVVWTTLGELPEALRRESITKTAILLVGPGLTARGKASRLYDKKFSHGYREVKRNGEEE
ncbi:MAG: precorrin-4 C(11)-methyltransferase [Euryarchaeota archaeon]|nr:precorrin-4 C(11)-methyltransferase [Euryarchaeota archaeon]